MRWRVSPGGRAIRALPASDRTSRPLVTLSTTRRNPSSARQAETRAAVGAPRVQTVSGSGGGHEDRPIWARDWCSLDLKLLPYLARPRHPVGPVTREGRHAMSLWDVMVSIFWFMLLVAWFWLLMSIITDVFRDEDLSGAAKAAWCIFVILLPWVGVLTYMIVRGRSMSDRAGREAARNEQASRSYVREVAVTEGSGVSGGNGVSGEISQLADLRDRGLLTPE